MAWCILALCETARNAPEEKASEYIEAAKRALYTGHYGDGKIFVSTVDNVIKIRTGEEGFDALQDKEIA